MARTTQQILPWTNSELKTLLQELVAYGTETSKVDFKAEIEAGTSQQKAELLKDISAIANTYGEHYNDHGFLIFGIKAKTIVGTSVTELDTDKLQNHIEQLLKNYIAPMPQIYIVPLTTPADQKWGAIVIPPQNNKPHMFFKDLQCTDPKYRRVKGEWFVRRGSTTDPGLPEDLALIMHKQTKLLVEPLHESIRNVQSRLIKVEEQYNSALFKFVERATSPTSTKATRPSEESEELTDAIGEALRMDLPTRLKQTLRTPKDALAEDLITEAKVIQDYLDGAETALPWAPQLNDHARSKKVVEDLEEKTRTFQLSVATIMLNDDKNTYAPALLRALKVLGKTTEAPSGIQYNWIGTALRYYPLGLILYTIFICGVAKGRSELLKQILEIPIKDQRMRKQTSHILLVFRYWDEAKALFNDAFGQRHCEPISQRIRQIINDRIGEMLIDVSEPEFFFRGEFALALTYIDFKMTSGANIEHRVPLPGLYLYMHEMHSPVIGLIQENPEWLNKLYDHPLNEILDMFDRNSHKVAAPHCITTGLSGLKTAEVYQEALQKKAQ